MTTPAKELVRDLLLLYVRYGPEAFREAANMLAEGFVSEALSDLLTSLSAMADSRARPAPNLRASTSKHYSRKAKRPRVAENRPNVSQSGHSQSVIEAAVENITKEIEERTKEIEERSVLGENSSLKDYLDRLGIPLRGTHLDRRSLAKKIANRLLALPETEAKRHIAEARDMVTSKSSLEAWTNVIVEPSSKQKE